MEIFIKTVFSFFQLKEEVSVIGRICCDSNGKLNPQSVILEGSQELSSGQRIKLDLSELRQFALFPGQVMYYVLFITLGISLVIKSCVSHVILFLSGCTYHVKPFIKPSKYYF